jgi:hypothetical protein
MRAVHRAAKRRLLRVATGHRHRKIGESGAGPLDRMQVDPAALDTALHHAVAHAWPGQLHDHVRRAEQQRHAHQPVVETDFSARAAARQPGHRRIAHRALDMADWLADRHRTPTR